MCSQSLWADRSLQPTERAPSKLPAACFISIMSVAFSDNHPQPARAVPCIVRACCVVTLAYLRLLRCVWCVWCVRAASVTRVLTWRRCCHVIVTVFAGEAWVGV
jgi:hypothetical protein